MRIRSSTKKIHEVHVKDKKPFEEYRTLCGAVITPWPEDIMPDDMPVTCRKCLREIGKLENAAGSKGNPSR